MMTSVEREELRVIQQQLKSFFPSAKHKVREIPGSSKKWIYLPWQSIRERLDEVAPDWMSDFSKIQYVGNDAICRGAITIMGIRKEAIASVPISLQSKSGNEMTRGSAADRLYAEAMKNASESWGVGAYLDDQLEVIRYLWGNKHLLSDEMEGEIRKLCEQYKKELSAPQKAEIPTLKNANPKLITPAQAKRLWAIAKGELRLDDEIVKSVYKKHGFEKTEQITSDQYELVITQLRQATQQPQIATSTINRSLVYQEIESLMKRKNISFADAKKYNQQWFGVVSRDDLSDSQLIELRDNFSLLVVSSN